MRSRRERKEPERLEAGPATSKWSSGTAASADKTQSVSTREARKGAEQHMAPKPTATTPTAAQATRKRGAGMAATGDSGKKQLRLPARRTSESVGSSPSKKNKAAAEHISEAAKIHTDTGEDLKTGNDDEQEQRRPRLDDETKAATEAAVEKESTTEPEAQRVGFSGNTEEEVSPPEGSSKKNEPLDNSRRPNAAGCPGPRKSTGRFLHGNPASSVAKHSAAPSPGSVPVPPARAPPRKQPAPATRADIPTATASPASVAAAKSAAAAARAISKEVASTNVSTARTECAAKQMSKLSAQATNQAAAATPAAKAAEEQQAARAATVVDALLSRPIQKRPWTQVEHARFLDALHFYHRDWRRVARHVGHDRTVADVCTHSQGWNSRSTEYGDGVLIPVAKDKKGKDIKKKGVPTKRLEPMHTPVPHDHDGTRAHLGGATPTTVLESALKQVTFTAILPGINSVVEESTKALEEEWADQAEAASTQEEEEEKAKTERTRRSTRAGATWVQLSQKHKKRRADIRTKTKRLAAAAGAVGSVQTDEQQPAAEQKSKLSQKQRQSQEQNQQAQERYTASNPMQLQLYRAMRSYSQLSPADKLKERRYAGLGLGRATQYRDDCIGTRNKPPIVTLQQRQQRQQQQQQQPQQQPQQQQQQQPQPQQPQRRQPSPSPRDSQQPQHSMQTQEQQHEQQQTELMAAKIREQCPRCSSRGIKDLPCVCHHALIGNHAHDLQSPRSLRLLLPKLPHKRLLVLPPARSDGEDVDRTKVISHDDPRLSGNSEHLHVLLQCAGRFKKQKLDSDPAASWANSHESGLASVPPGLEQLHPPGVATTNEASGDGVTAVNTGGAVSADIGDTTTTIATATSEVDVDGEASAAKTDSASTSAQEESCADEGTGTATVGTNLVEQRETEMGESATTNGDDDL